MKGYFSRITKQSGLRFSGQKALPSLFLAGEPTADNRSPIETEETIMIPPAIPAKRSMGGREARRSETPDAPPKSAAAPEQSENPSRPSFTETPVIIGGESDKEPVLKELRLVTPPVAKVKHPSPVKTGNDLLSEQPSSEFSVAEQTVFKETKNRERPKPSTVEPVAVEPLESKEFKPAESLSPPEKQKKEYFSKTAEIIKKGETGTAEIQNVLFHEVREWVAAAPANREMPAADAPGQPEVTITKQVAPSRSPGVLTVREKSHRENAETSEPMEQSFDLSIGTISVVIEGAENPPQPVPPQTNNRQRTQETKREFSRLSRNYL